MAYPIVIPTGALIKRAIDFSYQSRKLLFPMLCHKQLPEDLQLFDSTYNNGNAGVFLIAKDHRGKIVGCIAARPYNHRFKLLRLHTGDPTYEICRLYVLPAYRHQKIGGMLFSGIRLLLQSKGTKQLYLHTHPFLDGAQSFWEKMGFRLIRKDQDPPFHTIHMQHMIK